MIKFVGTAQNGKGSLLYYCQANGGQASLQAVESHDGFTFDGATRDIVLVDDTGREEKNFNWKSVRIAKQEHQYFLSYKSPTSPLLLGAISSNLVEWEKVGTVTGVKETGTVVPDYKYTHLYSVMYFGEKTIRIAFSAYLHQWKPQKKVVLEPRKNKFDNGDLEVGNAYVTEDGILLLYYVKTKHGNKTRYAVGAALFDKEEPSTVIWRSDEPVWEHPEELHHESMTPLGSIIIDNELILYWLIGEHNVFAVPCPIPSKHAGLKDKAFSAIVKKHDKNPIIAPRENISWESRATFNSAAIYDNGKVHFMYRALGEKDLSVLGYATSSDGLTIDERSDEPIYIPREPFETPGGNAFATFAEHYASGGGYGGVEDPRVTRVEDRLYLTYVAFDGANPPRAAMSSIDIEDFRKKNWGMWAKAKLISAPGMINKSAVIFPKKVNGKYVVLHRVYPNILVDFLDDLEFNDYLQGHYFIPPRKKFWDSKKVGAGAPPMETKDGWLLIYQSVGYQDPGRYKIGAMMLDKNNPQKVLYRTHTPIIEPEESYENDGYKAGVVYPCGAVIMNNKLNVYYGGADTVVCAASSDLDKFLYEMKRNKEPKLRKVHTPLAN